MQILLIVMANLAYCVLTGLILHRELGLTSFGRLYFIAEMAVILFIVFLEFRVYLRLRLAI